MEYIGNIILPKGILWGGKVVCENGIITQIVENVTQENEDLPYIAPGFVDIHNHGALGHDYMEAQADTFRLIAGHLAAHGVTSAQCATVSAPLQETLDFIRAYRAYQKAPATDRCRFVGIHLEGPYLSQAAKGAHPGDVLLIPEKDGYSWVLENSDVVGEMTVAPELAGMPQMIRDLTKAGILVSGGHDAAEPEDIQAAAAAGMRHCTHIYNAMSTLHKTNGHRRHGLVEFAMTSEDLTAEMIGDGRHIPALLAKMIYKMKGADKLCLVSDAIAPAGLPESDKVYSLGTGENCTKVRVEQGVAMVEDRSRYAGSVQALDQMVRNMVFDCQIPLHDAVTMASLTPATVIGIAEECGSIATGKRADLCILNKELQVVKTVIGGQEV